MNFFRKTADSRGVGAPDVSAGVEDHVPAKLGARERGNRTVRVDAPASDARKGVFPEGNGACPRVRTRT